VGVLRRALPVLLAIAAAYADARGAHGVARDLLLGAIPIAAVAALEEFGAFLETREDAVRAAQAVLWTLALALLVLSSAARSASGAAHTLPPLGGSALVAALVVFAAKLFVGAAAILRRSPLVRPAKP